MSAVGLDDRLVALADRGARLRAVAKPLAAGGLCVIPLASLFWCADPAGNGAFETYVAVPACLAAPLRAAGAGIVQVGPGLLATGLPALFAWIAPLFLVVGRLVRPWWARFGLIVLSPIWVAPVVSLLPGEASRHVDAARMGVLVDRDGLPSVAKDGTGAQVAPFRVRPDRFAPIQADAARFVLAQQAYIDADPRRVGANLAAMRGAWHPEDAALARRLGILVAYAAAAGRPTGRTAALAGSWHPRLRRGAAFAILLGGVALIALGASLDATGLRRGRRGEALSKRLAELVTVPVSLAAVPAPRRVFGSRRG